MFGEINMLIEICCKKQSLRFPSIVAIVFAGIGSVHAAVGVIYFSSYIALTQKYMSTHEVSISSTSACCKLACFG